MKDPLEGDTPRTSDRDLVSTQQERIAALAKQSPDMAFTSLNHYLSLPWLREAFLRTRRDAAVGVDGVTYEQYAEDLDSNLESLLERAKSGLYRSPPVKRVYIEKGGSSKEKRPIGIPTLEDKVLQRAVLMILEAIYEQDFHEGSYGYRPKRSPRQALDAMRSHLMQTHGGWVLEADIQDCFGSLDHAHLREFLQRRVRDGVLLRLIGKWLNAGVMENGIVHHPETGSPQGGVISALLANVYLHYVLDQWFAEDVTPLMTGAVSLIRYADDFVLMFQHESDARRVERTLPKRFAKYGLTLHPTKTRLVRFPRPWPRRDPDPKSPKPGTFDFLGFTVFWGRTRNGGWALKTKTAADRFRRTASRINDWCRRNRHRPIPEQQRKLGEKLRGHYQYFGRSGNYDALLRMHRLVVKLWQKWLSRRSWKAYLSWKKFRAGILARHPLPQPTITQHDQGVGRG